MAQILTLLVTKLLQHYFVCPQLISWATVISVSLKRSTDTRFGSKNSFQPQVLLAFLYRHVLWFMPSSSMFHGQNLVFFCQFCFQIPCPLSYLTLTVLFCAETIKGLILVPIIPAKCHFSITLWHNDAISFNSSGHKQIHETFYVMEQTFVCLCFFLGGGCIESRLTC